MSALSNMLSNYPKLAICKDDIISAYNILKTTFQNGGKVLVCGNGGSASDSEHIVGELMKGFMLTRKLPEDVCNKIKTVSGNNGDYICSNLQGALPAISLVSHSALISAFSNDIAADMVFAQQVYGYGKPGDCFIGLSTSGKAKNVIYAAQVAKAIGLKSIALTGQTGGELKIICDVVIKVPSTNTPQIQEYHLPVYHTLCMMIENKFFDSTTIKPQRKPKI